AEVARHEGISEPAIRSILCRARASVREQLAAGLAAAIGLARRLRHRVDRTAAGVENVEAAAGSYAGAQVAVNVICAFAIVLAPAVASASTPWSGRSPGVAVSGHPSIANRVPAVVPTDGL